MIHRLFKRHDFGNTESVFGSDGHKRFKEEWFEKEDESGVAVKVICSLRYCVKCDEFMWLELDKEYIHDGKV